METPTTTSAAQAAAPITMYAPKRSTMIDDLDTAFINLVSEVWRDGSDGSPPVISERIVRRRRRSPRIDRSTLERAPVTCTSCQVTYLAGSASSTSPSPDGWVCNRCLDERSVESDG